MGVTHRVHGRRPWKRVGWPCAIAVMGISHLVSAAPPATTAPVPAPSTAAAAVTAKPAPAIAAPAPAPAAQTPSAAPAAPAAQAPAATAAASVPPPAPPKLSAAAALRAATQGLASANPSEVRKALLALAELRGDGAARALATRMHAGLPPALLADAIDVAVQLGSPRAVPELLELLQYKRPSVRKLALSALAALKAKNAQPALLAALDDPDADVRRAAVDALAEIGTVRALPALLAQVERGQPGALQAVGKLAAARDLATLLAAASGGDVTPLKPALQVWLDGAPRAPAQQLELVAALVRVASPSARTYLVEWLDAAKSAGNPRVRQALFAAIKRLDEAAAPAVATTKTTRTVVQGVQVSNAQTVQIARADRASASGTPAVPAVDSASASKQGGR